MSYIDSNLLPDERVLHRATLHWAMFVPHVLLMLVLVGFVTVLVPVMRKLTTEMAVTNKRIVIKTGGLSRRTLEINLAKVETIGVEQGILGRILGYGALTVVGSGGTKERFAWVSRPLDFRQHFNQAT